MVSESWAYQVEPTRNANLVCMFIITDAGDVHTTA